SKIIVIAGGRHWRTAVGSHDTTFGHRAIFGALSGSCAGLFQSSHSLLSLGGQCRNSSVRWIDDDGRTPRLDELRSPIPPELVICVREVLGLHGSIDHTSRRRLAFTKLIHITALDCSLFKLGSF